MRTGDEEARSPKYAHIERERRFLVDRATRPALTRLPWVEIEDRYLDGTRLRLRRMRDSATGAVVFKLTKKYETGDVRARPIVTAYLTEAEYHVFAALPARRLVKRRYKVEIEGGAFGIDLFQGELEGLVLAEVESADDAALSTLIVPDWGIDVSDDPRFEGGFLSQLTAVEMAAALSDALG
jgi:CYTH domain-containing protein